MTDTVFALATAPGRAAIAVIRVSGPQTAAAVTALAGDLPPPRRASVRRLRDGADRVLDEALVLWLPGPSSFTGEDSAELHVHGGQAVVEAVSRALAEAGLRLAEPGEFTRRAFDNGRLDLAQAEGLADLIDAETEAQRRQALDQLGGALSDRHDRWRARLIESLALLEAAVDFPDEDLPEDVAARSEPPIHAMLGELDAALSDRDRGRIVRDGFHVALVGAPNAGKSSLLNRLAGRDAAIVTPIPGTTRDVVEAPMVVEGFRVLLADTAGLRPTEDLVEAEGVRRARAWAEGAQLRIWVVDASLGSGPEGPPEFLRAGDLLALNKADLPADPAAAVVGRAASRHGLQVVPTSALSTDGVAALREALAERVVEAGAGADFPAVTRERHRRHLQSAREHLVRAVGALGASPELAAEDVRLAVRELEQISGRVSADDVLDRVFTAFCIGK